MEMNPHEEQGNEAEEDETHEIGTRLILPCSDPKLWACVEEVLRGPSDSLADLDTMLTKFRALDPDRPHQVCTFFKTVPGSAESGKFDFDLFFVKGMPLMIEVALEMPQLFDGVEVPIFKMRSSWDGPNILGKKSVTLTRRQCACLLAHSFFGSLQRPNDVQRNDFRFTVSDLFMGTAVSPNSATTWLNYFTILGNCGIPDGSLTFERQGYQKGPSPWTWEENMKPLCPVEFVIGAIEDSPADVHVDFANAFVGGGVMTGDAAMEEILFLVKPELMVAMALENRMVDEEVVSISGALQYSLTVGYGTSLEFAGDCTRPQGGTTRVCAIDAVRGGSNLERRALLRDLNKARIAFEGASQVASGHWGCGAYGNNEDLMFLKQWMAASEAGATKMYYHDKDKKHSHHCLPLQRKLRHKTVGGLWDLLCSIEPCTVKAFGSWVADFLSGKIDVTGSQSGAVGESNPTSASGCAVVTVEHPSPTVAPVPPAAGCHHGQASASSSPGGSGQEGEVVLYNGVEMICIKKNAGRVRLQRPDGTSTWVSMKEVTFT